MNSRVYVQKHLGSEVEMIIQGGTAWVSIKPVAKKLNIFPKDIIARMSYLMPGYDFRNKYVRFAIRNGGKLNIHKAPFYSVCKKLDTTIEGKDPNWDILGNEIFISTTFAANIIREFVTDRLAARLRFTKRYFFINVKYGPGQPFTKLVTQMSNSLRRLGLDVRFSKLQHGWSVMTVFDPEKSVVQICDSDETEYIKYIERQGFKPVAKNRYSNVVILLGKREAA